VAGRDLTRGLVLLASEPLPGAPPIEAADRAGLAPGQWAIAVGRGWTHAAPNVSVGILSAVSRAWGRAVQTDAAVSPANYGGPLLDIHGRVIGILAPLPADTAGMTRGTELYDSGIGFAVPLADVRAVLPRLQRGEPTAPGLLGIAYRSRDQINGAPVIASCRSGSPAARAGLTAGDRIVAVDGAPTPRIADVRHRILPRYAGDTIAIEVERTDGEPRRREMEITLVATLPPWRRAVIGVVPAPADAAERGLTVGWVLPGGPAARAGIVPGDVIAAVGVATASGTASLLDGPDAIAAALGGCEPGERVDLVLAQAGARKTIELVTAAAPADLPDPLPPPRRGAVAADAVRVEPLAAAEIPRPPLVVLPTGTGPVGVLVYLDAPHGPVEPREADAWREASGRRDVAVILPGSLDDRRWTAADVPGIQRAILTLGRLRPIDSARVAVAGRGPGGGFAWLVAERLAPLCRGVAILGAPLPRQATIAPADPAAVRWLLFSATTDESLARTIAADRRRLEQAGRPAGMLPPLADEASAADALAAWVGLLGLL
jgi:serine protease Do